MTTPGAHARPVRDAAPAHLALNQRHDGENTMGRSLVGSLATFLTRVVGVPDDRPDAADRVPRVWEQLLGSRDAVPAVRPSSCPNLHRLRPIESPRLEYMRPVWLPAEDVRRCIGGRGGAGRACAVGAFVHAKANGVSRTARSRSSSNTGSDGSSDGARSADGNPGRAQSLANHIRSRPVRSRSLAFGVLDPVTSSDVRGRSGCVSP
jgi:hypothetical protein